VALLFHVLTKLYERTNVVITLIEVSVDVVKIMHPTPPRPARIKYLAIVLVKGAK